MNEHVPDNLRFIPNFNTKNLNKAAFLIAKGAVYLRAECDSNGIATIFLNNVTRHASKEFWNPEALVPIWGFLNSKRWLQDQIVNSRVN